MGFLSSLLLCGTLGCAMGQHRSEETEQPLRSLRGIRVAVAPAQNFSGNAEFDAVQVADLMASELSSFPDVMVIGVNRVLAILAEQGVDQIQSPEHALDVCDRLGVDALLVFAVTEYNAYTPVVGLAAQLYGPVRLGGAALDPVAASRMARPFPVAAGAGSNRLQAQVQRVFNAAHDQTRLDVQRYAHARGASETPYGWQRYLASQKWYLRYCCFTVARDLMRQRMEGPAVARRDATKELES